LRFCLGTTPREDTGEELSSTSIDFVIIQMYKFNINGTIRLTLAEIPMWMGFS